LQAALQFLAGANHPARQNTRVLRGARRALATAAREADTRKGDRVSFERSDVFLPSPEELLPAPAEEIEGVVIGFSDSGTQSRVYALVEVVQRQEVVVPIEKLHVIGPARE
jgi:hypothetical protein